MKNFDLKKFIAENKATFYSSLNEDKTTSVGKSFFITKGDESMGISPGKYTIVKSYVEDDENVYDIKDQKGKTITVTQDYVQGKGYWKNSPLATKDLSLKESKLRSKIREMVLAEMENFNINDETSEVDFLAELEGMLAEKELNQKPSKKDKETEAADDVTVDDTEDVEIEDTEIDTSEVDPTVKAVQDALTQAQAASQKLGDEKLSNQIGNTITYFTRAHISKPNTLKEFFNTNRSRDSRPEENKVYTYREAMNLAREVSAGDETELFVNVVPEGYIVSDEYDPNNTVAGFENGEKLSF